MKNSKTLGIIAAVLFALFVLTVIAVTCIDVAPVGPLGSEIGMSHINSAVNKALGESEGWYEATELIGYAAIAAAGAFALLALVQLIKRKSFKNIDLDLYILASAYAVMAICYVIFEVAVINYRPVLEEGELAASFPSSHTMLVTVIMGTAAHQLGLRLKNAAAKGVSVGLCSALIAVMAAGRLFSGVHWLTDILGGLFLGFAVVFAYMAVCNCVKDEKDA